MTNIYSRIKFSLLLLILVIALAHQASAATIRYDLTYDVTHNNGIAKQSSGDSRSRCAENAEYDGRAPRMYPEYKGTGSKLFKTKLGPARTVELRSHTGDKLSLKISPLAFTRTNKAYYGSKNTKSGPFCYSRFTNTLAYLEKAMGVDEIITMEAYKNVDEKFFLFSGFDITDFNQLAPGIYQTAFSFTQDEVYFRARHNLPIEPVHASVTLHVTGHVFDVQFPNRAVVTDPANRIWREIPIDIYTNENFKISYWCRPSGGNDYGVNDQGFCKVAENGPALGVKLKFPHINYDEEIAPDIWKNFLKNDFSLNNQPGRHRGFIGFKLQDIELGSTRSPV